MTKYYIINKDDVTKIEGHYPAPQSYICEAPKVSGVYVRDISIVVVNDILIDSEYPELGTRKVASVDVVLKANKDAQDIQNGRESKLDKIRLDREDKLKELDHMINDLSLGSRADAAALSSYKSDLLDITNSYKDNNGATVALDSLSDDLSDLVWPAKP